jgi:hypothetical protein
MDRYDRRELSRSSLVVLAAIIITSICIVGGLFGCATANLPQNATLDQRNAALCKDAQFGVTLATAMLNDTPTPEYSIYWQKYLKGASLAMQTYCLSK